MIKFSRFCKSVLASLLVTIAFACAPLSKEATRDAESNAAQNVDRPNVLLVYFDDMNDWLDPFSELPGSTPNLEAFSNDAFVFQNAFAVSPSCNPSRVSMLTGVHPTVSGVYENDQVYPEVDHWIRTARNLPQHFRDNGYLAAGYGKVFHHRHPEAYAKADHWTPNYYVGWDLAQEEALPDQAEELIEIKSLQRRFGILPDDWDLDDPAKMQQDTKNTIRAAEFLQQRHDKPFFLSLGIYRPHSNWYAARRYWDKFPREEISFPPGVKDSDLEDVPPFGRYLALRSTDPDESPDTFRDLNDLPEHKEEVDFARPILQPYVVEHDYYKDAARAYMATMSYADDMFGRIMDALDQSEYAENTIVIVVSDHGYHLGEKNHWHKATMWERSLRVPFMVRGTKEMSSNHKTIQTPVSLLDVYPMLMDLVDIQAPSHEFDGVNIAPIMLGENDSRGRPVVSTFYRGMHSVRDNKYRYIRYPDSTEELYDLENDRWEFDNLAIEPTDQHKKVITDLRKWLPENEEEKVGEL